jgi:hypothetical protein
MKPYQIILLLFTIAIIVALLTGCTTTKTVEVPVPVPCTKPKNIPVPHDYLVDLSKHASAKEFVPACLATREGYRNAYQACMMYQEGT